MHSISRLNVTTCAVFNLQIHKGITLRPTRSENVWRLYLNDSIMLRFYFFKSAYSDYDSPQTCDHAFRLLTINPKPSLTLNDAGKMIVWRWQALQVSVRSMVANSCAMWEYSNVRGEEGR
jgi:hypothetical protein